MVVETKKDVKLQESPKVTMFEYNDAIERLLKQSKEELNILQHNCLLATNQLKQTQEAIQRERSNFEQWKREQEAKHKNDMSLIKNSLDEREHRIKIGEQNYSKRDFDLKQKEVQMMALVEERNKVNNDRIDIEKLRVKANELLQDVNRKSGEATNKSNIVAMREKEIKDIVDSYNTKNQDISHRENILNQRDKEYQENLKNMNELKKTVEPKIKELSFMEENIKKTKEEVTRKEMDILRKIEENKAILRGMEEKDNKLKEKERFLNTKEEEVLRKSLLAGIK